MDYLRIAILEFIRLRGASPFPAGAPTRLVLTTLRSHLDATAPDWRERAFDSAGASGATGVEVGFYLASGRVVRGVLIQRPSDVRDEWGRGEE